MTLNFQTVNLTFGSSPSGFQLTVGTGTSTAPFTRTVIVGSNVFLTAPSPQVVGPNIHQFASWSDNLPQTHSIIAGTAAATFTASYNLATTTTVAPDRTVFVDGLSSVTTAPFSTSYGSELVLAFVAADGPSAGGQTATVSGAGLQWTLVRRANGQAGTSEIWKANAADPLSNATVTSTLGASGFLQSLTVVSFTASNGLGAVASLSAPTGAPSVSLTAAQGSLIYGVGSDWDRAIARTLPANQTMVHEYLAAVGDTFWVQRLNGWTAAGGQTLNVTSPTADRWNFVAVEILQAAQPVTVPDVVGLTQEAATSTLTSAGLTVATTSGSSATVPAGSVISQNPLADALVAAGTTVTLVISTGPPPVITSATTASGTVGVAFSYQITATNAPTSYGATGLPAGLSVNNGTGLISGTPTVAGPATVTLSATNSAGSGTATLTLTIAAAPPVITSATTASGAVGVAFSYQITATNAPTSYGATGLPGGLSVNTATGLISGTPTDAGTATVTLSATNSGRNRHRHPDPDHRPAAAAPR